jgi:hypothetical protein
MRRATTFAIGAVAVSALAAAEISSTNAIGPSTSKSTFLEDVAWNRVDPRGAAGPTPTPLQCLPCQQRIEFNENFDSVTPPALPPGWVATNALGPQPLWVTSNSGVPVPPADTPPNAAFIDDPGVPSDKRLDVAECDFFEGTAARLTFRHNFNLEASDPNPSLGFDGGVLELSFDGGNTFQDILAVGGTFVTGGYNRVISADRGSPIAGRQAWSGNSGGYMTTVVNMPTFPIACILRWRMASDNSGSGEGWRVDTVNIAWCHGIPCPPTPTPTPTPRPNPTSRPRPTPAPRL